MDCKSTGIVACSSYSVTVADYVDSADSVGGARGAFAVAYSIDSIVVSQGWQLDDGTPLAVQPYSFGQAYWPIVAAGVGPVTGAVALECAHLWLAGNASVTAKFVGAMISVASIV